MLKQLKKELNLIKKTQQKYFKLRIKDNNLIIELLTEKGYYKKTFKINNINNLNLNKVFCVKTFYSILKEIEKEEIIFSIKRDVLYLNDKSTSVAESYTEVETIDIGERTKTFPINNGKEFIKAIKKLNISRLTYSNHNLNGIRLYFFKDKIRMVSTDGIKMQEITLYQKNRIRKEIEFHFIGEFCPLIAGFDSEKISISLFKKDFILVESRNALVVMDTNPENNPNYPPVSNYLRLPGNKSGIKINIQEFKKVLNELKKKIKGERLDIITLKIKKDKIRFYYNKTTKKLSEIQVQSEFEKEYKIAFSLDRLIEGFKCLTGKETELIVDSVDNNVPVFLIYTDQQKYLLMPVG